MSCGSEVMAEHAAFVAPALGTWSHGPMLCASFPAPEQWAPPPVVLLALGCLVERLNCSTSEQNRLAEDFAKDLLAMPAWLQSQILADAAVAALSCGAVWRHIGGPFAPRNAASLEARRRSAGWMVARMVANALTITTSANEPTAMALCPWISRFNHSCRPNTVLRWEGHRAVVLLTADVSEGEQLCLSYGPHAGRMQFDDRQRWLQDQYCFECRCAACNQGTSPSPPRTLTLTLADHQSHCPLTAVLCWLYRTVQLSFLSSHCSTQNSKVFAAEMQWMLSAAGL